MPKPQPSIPGLVIGGTGSNSGKTTLTLALLCALHKRGLAARAAKTGPDYIDAAFHADLTGQPAANLDTWMCRESAPSPGSQSLRASGGLPKGLLRVFERMRLPDRQTAGVLTTAAPCPPDLLVVEGAMGIFDGGHNGAGSTAHLGSLLGLPILLVLNAGGMGQSVTAMAEGFLHHRPAWAKGRALRFLGMVCTHVGSARHADLLRQSLAPLGKSEGVPLLGLLPRQGAPALAARHLGLVEAHEALPAVDRQALAQWAEDHCDLDLLLRLAGVRSSLHPASMAARMEAPAQGQTPAGATPACLRPDCAAQPADEPENRRDTPHGHKCTVDSDSRQGPAQAMESESAAMPLPASRFFVAAATACRGRSKLVVGLAWDEAFSFCYADLPAVLRELRAEVVAFSPLRDAAPPTQCSGLYFPGGYPELHAAGLTANTPMREALHRLAAQGMPMYGECGGYMYLMRSLQLNGRQYAMSGLLPRSCALGATRAALGYRAATAAPGFLPSARANAQGNTSGNRPLWVRGHEFHYAQEQNDPLPPQCSPLWKLYDSQGLFLRDDGCRLGSVAGAWLHCYPEGSRRFWRAWLGLCAAYNKDQRS
ncbi:cobyrinate a,c-diamide synthase [Desulfovibrio desulfuricans]|uniref:Cobyrinate a,c-diamide synthase n=1 Tax=Desulfovibrio desulfuricans TaxID=876 RepID=A0A4P7UHY4_DESDE|nr:cobyrinate a,c-diamide synthase [Desulfovibrio desulfuricans]QCC84314.1 cobyrinate a,c-diamide synthase [Desulfovibrio desulfuricans]